MNDGGHYIPAMSEATLYTPCPAADFEPRALGRAECLRLWPLLEMKTYVATPASRERNWLVVDASGQTLGRLATRIADALRGKRKPEYTPHVDVGDFVIVVNAEKIAVSGNKREEKRYYRHSGYPGGLRSRTLEEMLARRPEEVIRLAVKGMLPRNRLGRAQLRKLKIYSGPDHPHAAQKPEPMEVPS
jgi:large subunit ribosomal protein L13